MDSSALLALIKMEPGAEVVSRAMGDGIVSPVIMAESLSKAASLGHDAAEVERRLLETGLRIEPISIDDVRAVAGLYALAKHDVSLADRFCLALAIQRGLPLITSDRPWRDLGLPVELRFFR
jgi:ribonuclease VapC